MMATGTGLTSTVEAEDKLAYAYLPADSGNYSRSYLVLDWGRRQVDVEWRNSSQTGMTFYEWHGHQVALPLPANVDARRLTEWITEHMPTLVLIADGYESAWDGNNHVAQFSAAASAALDNLAIAADMHEGWDLTLALPDGEGMWAASDWLYETRLDHVGPRSTDAEIAAVVADLEKDALAEGIRLEGAEEYLQSVRDELRDDAEEA
jgi:hypothetical protein